MVKRSRDDSASSVSDSASSIHRLSTSTGSPKSTAERSIPYRAKYTQLDRGLEHPPESIVMRCFLPPHPQGMTFSSYEEYDVHYAKAHVNRCLECRKNFPTEHYLGLHIEENHDPLNEARKARGDKTVRHKLMLLWWLSLIPTSVRLFCGRLWQEVLYPPKA